MLLKTRLGTRGFASGSLRETFACYGCARSGPPTEFLDEVQLLLPQQIPASKLFDLQATFMPRKQWSIVTAVAQQTAARYLMHPWHVSPCSVCLGRPSTTVMCFFAIDLFSKPRSVSKATGEEAHEKSLVKQFFIHTPFIAHKVCLLRLKSLYRLQRKPNTGRKTAYLPMVSTTSGFQLMQAFQISSLRVCDGC